MRKDNYDLFWIFNIVCVFIHELKSVTDSYCVTIVRNVLSYFKKNNGL